MSTRSQTKLVLLLLLQDADREWDAGEIARRLASRPRTINPILDRLAEVGWITRGARCRLTSYGAGRAHATLASGLTPTFTAIAAAFNLSTAMLNAPPLSAHHLPSPQRIARELGNQLRGVRRRRAWTRRQLLEHMDSLDISGNTLATWELGTRHLSVVRLYQLCHVLDVPPHELIRRTDHALALPSPGMVVTVDVASLLHSTRPELAPIRRWAATTHPGRPDDRMIALTAAALKPLAELCGLTPEALLDAIRDLQ